MAITFDGPTLTITVTSPGSYTVKRDFFSAWKEWVLLSDNAKYHPAFDVLGGDPTTATDSVAPYFFLRNDLGWKVKAPEANGEVTIDGNLFARDPSIEFLYPSSGPYTTMFRLLLSSRATVTTVGAGGSGLTPTQDTRLALIEKILRNKMVTDPTTGVATLYDDDGITPLATAQLYESADTSQAYRGQGVQRRERLE